MKRSGEEEREDDTKKARLKTRNGKQESDGEKIGGSEEIEQVLRWGENNYRKPGNESGLNLWSSQITILDDNVTSIQTYIHSRAQEAARFISPPSFSLIPPFSRCVAPSVAKAVNYFIKTISRHVPEIRRWQVQGGQ